MEELFYDVAPQPPQEEKIEPKRKAVSIVRREINRAKRGSTYNLGDNELREAFRNRAMRFHERFDYVLFSASEGIVKNSGALAFSIAFDLVKKGGVLEVPASFCSKHLIPFSSENEEDGKVIFLKQ